ncbi:MAG: NAD(P)-dependent oxidoreductase, partial [Bacteroidales bacterium]|nr:NAD(P)-dependent oxidoreductase [Bacteroidales bacterium]
MPAERRILIIDTVHPVLPDRLSGYGFKCDIDTGKTYDYYSGIIENYYGVILRSRITIDKAFIDAAKRLRFIGRVGSGLENIDVTHAKTKGVKCFNSPEGNRNAVGEHALGLLLSLLNRLHIADRQVREGRWLREENRGREIKNLSVGIIGYGNTGASFAGKLSGLGCRVLAYDKYKKGFGNSYVEEADYQDIFSEVDVVSLHVPLTDETYYLVNNTFLAQFHKPIVLINTSRGKVLDTGALVCHLKQGSVL